MTSSTDTNVNGYVNSNYFPKASSNLIDALLDLYPQNVSQGSPYGTGSQDALTPQYKRIASITGDYVFQGPRRFFLENRASRQNTWSFGEYSSGLIQKEYGSHINTSKQKAKNRIAHRLCKSVESSEGRH